MTNFRLSIQKMDKTPFFNDSYLTFCYSSDIEQKLFKECIPKIICELNELNKCCCFYEFNYPRNNENFNAERTLGFSCTDNKKHFKINHLKITFKSRDKNKHIEFWESITKELTGV